MDRRISDRRRRVLYSAHQAEQSPPTAASRRQAEQLRQARRPREAYGSRVHRRLRARWFSLVPVKRRTMFLVAAALGTLAVVLCAGHYASVTWPSLAYRGEVARPLRLDRPDSFGRWVIVALLTGSAGASFLIYQLRRYRNDDFNGQYRLWRLVMVVTLLASVHSLVGIIDWCGALMDAVSGRRVAMAGSDWVRLVVSLGGAVLALRLVAEVRHCRAALASMLLVCFALAIPEAAKWNVMQVDSIGDWALVTSAPLVACTALFISLTAYLRMLYREVRSIEDESLRSRLQQMRLRMFSRGDGEEEEVDESEQDETPRRRWWRRTRGAEEEIAEAEYEEEEEEYEEDEDEEETTDESDAQPRRGWFRRRRAAAQDEEPEASDGDSADETEPPKKKRRRFSMRLKPPAAGASDEESAEPTTAETSDDPPKTKRGLGGWMRRGKKQSEPDEAAHEPSDELKPAAAKDEINPDEIDWSSLSKSERRRLRKQLKRQNRAA